MLVRPPLSKEISSLSESSRTLRDGDCASGGPDTARSTPAFDCLSLEVDEIVNSSQKVLTNYEFKLDPYFMFQVNRRHRSVLDKQQEAVWKSSRGWDTFALYHMRGALKEAKKFREETAEYIRRDYLQRWRANIASKREAERKSFVKDWKEYPMFWSF